MATPVFVDTGAHYALADANDPDHEEAVRLLQ
jgi:predicted nucleic acid-binding protein